MEFALCLILGILSGIFYTLVCINYNTAQISNSLKRIVDELQLDEDEKLDTSNPDG